jgi:N utilization substance protein B
MVVVQAIYASTHNSLDLSQNLLEVLHYHSDVVEHAPRVNKEFAYKMINQIQTSEHDIRNIVSQYLADNWTIDKLDPLIRAILIAGVCELAFLPTPTKVIINEYTTLAADFSFQKEVGFINSVLDKAAQNLRSESL